MIDTNVLIQAPYALECFEDNNLILPLIIADKTDVRRSRVRQKEQSAFDIHDRVNYAVTESKLKIAKDKSVETLGTTFKLTVNGRKVL